MFTAGQILFMNLIAGVGDIVIDQKKDHINIRSNNEEAYRISEVQIQKERVCLIIRLTRGPIKELLQGLSLQYENVPESYGWGDCVKVYVTEDNLKEAVSLLKIIRELVK